MNQLVNLRNPSCFLEKTSKLKEGTMQLCTKRLKVNPEVEWGLIVQVSCHASLVFLACFKVSFTIPGNSKQTIVY